MQRGQIALDIAQARFEALPQFFAEYTFKQPKNREI